jgi:hypothetical protein
MQRWLNVRPQLHGEYIEVDQRELSSVPSDVGNRVAGLLGHGDPEKIGDYLATHFPERTQTSDYARYSAIGDIGWDESQQQTFLSICGSTMVAYGYDPSEPA